MQCNVREKRIIFGHMNNKSILLIDPEFDPKLSEELSLVVKIGADSFSYAIIDQDKKLVYAIYDEQECDDGAQTLNAKLKADAYLTLAYRSVKVAAHTENSVLVPNAFFDAESVALQSNHFINSDSTNIYAQPAENSEFTTVFSVEKDLENTINTQWPQSIKLVENAGLMNLANSVTSDTLIIDFTVGAFDIVYTKERQLIFQQHYQFDDVEEFTYYLMLIVSQLQIDTKITPLSVCGIISPGDEKWNRLTKYFSQVDFLEIQTGLNTTILDDMPAHYYTSLLSLYACG